MDHAPTGRIPHPTKTPGRLTGATRRVGDPRENLLPAPIMPTAAGRTPGVNAWGLVRSPSQLASTRVLIRHSTRRASLDQTGQEEQACPSVHHARQVGVRPFRPTGYGSQIRPLPQDAAVHRLRCYGKKLRNIRKRARPDHPATAREVKTPGRRPGQRPRSTGSHGVTTAALSSRSPASPAASR